MATPRRKLNLLHCSRSQTCFNYLPPGGIATICPSPPHQTYVIPSALLISNHEYTSGLIVRRATARTVAGPRLSGVVWVWDDTQSSTTEKPSLERKHRWAHSYKRVTICAELFHHRNLDGGTQFPPTIGQPKGLAASGLEKACGNPPQSLAQRPVIEESGCGASKQRLVARRIAAPPAESPDSLTLLYLCLAPLLRGRAKMY